MEAFAAGEIDAAQAMIYNEYAQVLEKNNPATGELYKAEDLNVISWEEYGTSMLQDAIFASEAWLAKPGNEDVAVKFLKASFRGWIFCRDNPAECVDIVLKSDAALPKGHQTWQLNEVNGIIWPAPNGIGITDAAAFDRTVQVALDGKILTKPVEGTAWRNDLAEKALAALGDADTKGASWQKATVTLTEGGQVGGPPSTRRPEAGRRRAAGLYVISARGGRRPVPGLVALVSVAALLFAACSRGEPRRRAPSVPPRPSRATPVADAQRRRARLRRSTPVRLQLQWYPQAQFAGYFAADRAGLLRGRQPRRRAGRWRRRTPAADRRLGGRMVRSSRSPGSPRCCRPGQAAAPSSSTSRQIFQRSGTLALVLEGSRTITRRPTSRARRSASGTSATSSRLPPGPGRGRPRARAPTTRQVIQDIDMAPLLRREVDVAEAMIYNEYAAALEATNPVTARARTSRPT